MTRKLGKQTCYFFIATDELKYLVHDCICSEAFPAAVLFRCGFSNIKSFGTFISLKSQLLQFRKRQCGPTRNR